MEFILALVAILIVVIGCAAYLLIKQQRDANAVLEATKNKYILLLKDSMNHEVAMEKEHKQQLALLQAENQKIKNDRDRLFKALIQEKSQAQRPVFDAMKASFPIIVNKIMKELGLVKEAKKDSSQSVLLAG